MLRTWFGRLGVKRLFITPGSLWENGYFRSFGVRLRGDLFYSLRETQIAIENWFREYSTISPYSSLGYKPPVPENIKPADPICAVGWLRSDRPNLGGPETVT